MCIFDIMRDRANGDNKPINIIIIENEETCYAIQYVYTYNTQQFTKQQHIMFENKQQQQATNCDLTVHLNNNKNNKEQLCNIFRLKVTYRTNQYIIKTQKLNQ